MAEAIRKFGVPEAAFGIDLGVVRGLDYYTGTIYETTLVQYPELGSICSGGRYDDLASYFTDTKLPGVGISIGLTRLFSKLREAGLLRPAGEDPGRGAGGDHGPALPRPLPRDGACAARGGRQHRGLPRAGEAEEPARRTPIARASAWR